LLFFDEVKREIYVRFADLYAGKGNGKSQLASERLNEKYGWYLTIKKVAESGLFNLTGYTPMESAEKAKLYQVFQYLASKAAEEKVIEDLSKQTKK
jgi:ABC-type molybdenum transport system ATPase subunit/photorepair protein PhrA